MVLLLASTTTVYVELATMVKPFTFCIALIVSAALHCQHWSEDATASVHFAYSVMSSDTNVLKFHAAVHAASVYHPPKVHPVSLNAAGSFATLFAAIVCEAGAVP